jgi:ribosomal protein L37AE/L43A
MQKKNKASSSEVVSNPYICYVCGYRSSVERTKSGEFICNECLKFWEGGKFYSRNQVNTRKELI